MALTQQEYEQLYAQILAQLRSESQSVDECRTVTTLDGVKSLPSMLGEEVVLVPIGALAKPATDAAVLANTAASNATAATTAANIAATEAKTAATEANTAADLLNTFLETDPKHVVLTEIEYNNLPSKDPNTFYYILEE